MERQYFNVQHNSITAPQKDISLPPVPTPFSSRIYPSHVSFIGRTQAP